MMTVAVWFCCSLCSHNGCSASWLLLAWRAAADHPQPAIGHP